MTKTFYTQYDVEDLHKRGVTSIVVDDNVVLTDIARDKARRLGVELLREQDKPAATLETPNISTSAPPTPVSKPTVTKPAVHKAPTDRGELQKRIHASVVARLGDAVDKKLLDTIIRRVLNNVSK